VLGGGSRRLVLQAIVGAGAVTASLVSSRHLDAAAQEATPDATAGMPRLDGPTFVGATSDPATFVAIVVAEASPDVAEREARAYLCNGADIAEWLDHGGVTGEGEGQLDLSSANGTHLSGTVSAATATGTISLPDGSALTFEAPRAAGAEGLYTFTVAPDGRVDGSSAEGARIDGHLQVTGTITLPDGTATPYQWPVAIDDTAEVRNISLAETGGRGTGRTRKGTRISIEW
jgi:hypothetical protein